MRFAIYARFSSEKQNEKSVEDQIRECRLHIEKSGGTLSPGHVFSDQAISGSHMVTRTGINKLMQVAKDHEFDAVVFDDLSRISRDQEDVAGIYKRLSFVDVKMVSLLEGEINEMHIGFKGTQNAMQLKQIAHGVRRGQKGRVQAGRIPGGISYGYDPVHEYDERGELIRGLRVINEEQAGVIRRIFDEYLLGKSAKSIASDLNKEGILSPRGGQWMASTINGNPARQNGILCNMLYTGKIVYNRQRFVKDPDTGKRQAKLNPTEEWITQEVEELRIIDERTWVKVQSMKRAIAGKPKSQQSRARHLFSGLIKCSECGGSYTVYGSGRYSCSHRRERGTCTNKRSIKIIDLEKRVLNALTHRMLTKEMLEEFSRGYSESLAEHRKYQNARKGELSRELVTVKTQIEGIINAIKDGLYSPAMKDEMNILEHRKARLEEEAEHLKEDNVITVKPNMAELYQKELSRITDALRSKDRHMLEASQILRSLIEAIYVTPAEGRGNYTLDLRGDLASILKFAQGEEVLVSMVAGEGFVQGQHKPIISVKA